jgi:hypothetical protein
MMMKEDNRREIRVRNQEDKSQEIKKQESR